MVSDFELQHPTVIFDCVIFVHKDTQQTAQQTQRHTGDTKQSLQFECLKMVAAIRWHCVYVCVDQFCFKGYSLLRIKDLMRRIKKSKKTSFV